MFSLWSPPNHVPNRYRGLVKKRNQITPIYLMSFSWRGYAYTFCGFHFYPFSNGNSLDSHLLFSNVFSCCILSCILSFMFSFGFSLLFSFYSIFFYVLWHLFSWFWIAINQHVDKVLHISELKLNWSFCMYFATFQRVSHVEAKPKGLFHDKFFIGFSR